jgi:hypothetical protein
MVNLVRICKDCREIDLTPLFTGCPSSYNVHQCPSRDSQICDTNCGSCLIFWVQNGRIFDLQKGVWRMRKNRFTESAGTANV